MGDVLSTLSKSTATPSDTQQKTLDTCSETTATPVKESSNKPPADGDQQTQEDQQQEINSEEEGECGFCLFMKGGGCKDSFIQWENCVKEGEKNKEDIVNKCFDATSAMKKCMEFHSDYYHLILHAEEEEERKTRSSEAS